MALSQILTWISAEEYKTFACVSGPSSCSGWVVKEAGGAGEKGSRAGSSGARVTVPRSRRSVSQSVVGFIAAYPQPRPDCLSDSGGVCLRLRQPAPLFLVHPGRKNNWPPLPEKFPVGPCFYHDISVDIPVEFQKTVKIMYNLWMCKRIWQTTGTER